MPDRTIEDRLDLAIDALLAAPAAEPAPSEVEELVLIAAALREMPAENFQSRLRIELQRRASMTTATATQIREGFRTVTPYISIPEGTGLIEFLTRTFDAEVTLRAPSPAGFHAELRIGDSMLMIGSGESLRGREKIGAFHVYVPDCDATYRRAIEAGASSMGEPADRPYGERSGFVKDFAGNHWYIATRFPDTKAPEGLGTMMPYVFPRSAREFIDFLKRAFGAVEMGVYEDSGRVMHAAVRIGDAVVEMGEPADELVLPFRFFLYVDDCDAWCDRAVGAGATLIQPPSDKPYGRTAVLLDPFGFEWIPASLLA